jgi:tetratricopeptide (TPR) repeat protein
MHTLSQYFILFVYVLTMMSSQRLHQSLELNNEGARLICKGQYGRAVSTFSEAMSTVKQMMADENRIAGNRDQDTAMLDSTSEYCSETISCMEAESSSYPEEAASCEDDSSPCFIFRKPLVMTLLDADECGDRTTVAKLSAIMMFNMALSHHLSALQHHKNATQLRAALMLYGNAYVLLQNEQVDICVLYNLALSNNLGQVLKAMKQQPQARQCFEQLLSILLCLVEYCDDEEKARLEGFFRSASPCILGSNTKAAPAA